jgi:aspartate carbamoyltransferase
VINPLKEQHILSVDQFNRDTLEFLFGVSDDMKDIVEREGRTDLLRDKVLALLFYEPSTRTASSFDAAMKRLGGDVVKINDPESFSSVAKGESLPDTVRTLNCYTDAIVLRHPRIGASVVASHYSRDPIINAGDGIGEHPTQALLDIYTIEEELETIDGRTVTLVGDLKNGRTVHSLAKLLGSYNLDLVFVSPAQLRMPREIKREIRGNGVHMHECEKLCDVIGYSDVVYITRIQKERFKNSMEFEELKGFYLIDEELMRNAKRNMIVMHPLPRRTKVKWDRYGDIEVEEEGSIQYAVDDDPRSVYLNRQMSNGMYMRMALLASIFDRIPANEGV